MIANVCFFPEGFVAPRRPAAWKEVVDKHHAMANKAVGADCYQFADECVWLNFGTIANGDIFLNFSERPNKTVVADGAAIKVGWRHHFHVTAEDNVVFYSALKNSWFVH